MHIFKLAPIAIALFAGSVGAQTMYRCGKSFSQEPCRPVAKVVTKAAVQPSKNTLSAEDLSAITEQCRQKISALPDWKDRDSLKFGSIYPSVTQTRIVQGVPMIVRSRTFMVNAKNSYGAYTGDKPAFCYADEEETKVVEVWVPSR